MEIKELSAYGTYDKKTVATGADEDALQVRQGGRSIQKVGTN